MRDRILSDMGVQGFRIEVTKTIDKVNLCTNNLILRIGVAEMKGKIMYLTNPQRFLVLLKRRLLTFRTSLQPNHQKRIISLAVRLLGADAKGQTLFAFFQICVRLMEC